MYDVVGGVRDFRRQAARRRANLALRRLGRDLDNLRHDLDDVRQDVYRGVFLREVRRLADSVADALPPIERRRRGPNVAVASAPAVAFAGLLAVAAYLLWDDGRRAAMRRRLEEVAANVGRPGRPTPVAPRGD